MTNSLASAVVWMAMLGERLSERPWFIASRQALGQFWTWLWSTGAPIVGGTLVLLSGVIVARAIRRSEGLRRRSRQHDWVEEQRGLESAGRWHPAMGMLRVRHRAGLSQPESRPLPLKSQKRA